VGVDVEGGLCPFGWKAGEGGDGDGDFVAYTGAVDDGFVRSFGEEASSEVGDHAWVIVSGGGLESGWGRFYIPTHRGETAMNGAPELLWVWLENRQRQGLAGVGFTSHPSR
jgi:hypothetical protein